MVLGFELRRRCNDGGFVPLGVIVWVSSVVTDALAAAGFDAEMMSARIQEQAVKNKLIAATEAAVARGVFGVPTFFIGTEMFFGQDRLDLIEQTLSVASS